MLLAAVALAVALVAYNTVTNRSPTSDATYLVRNLLVGGALVAGALAAGLSPAQLGLAPDTLADGWRWGRLVVLAVAVMAAAAGALADRGPVVADVLDDQRADLPPGRLAFQLLVRIPLGTALFEEVVFRGVLLAGFAEALGTGWAVVASSVVFGLWHIGPTRQAARENDVVDPRAIRRRVVVAVTVTTLGGAGLTLLRIGSGSLLTPVLTHAAINGSALLVAAARRQRRR